MSTRCYPLFIKGSPRLRIFLPNFWIKLVKPDRDIPTNMVKFIVSTEMTGVDVRNYLQNIYNVPVKEVKINIVAGTYKKDIGNRYIIKDEDFKVAHVILATGHKFEFPNLFPEAKKEEEAKDLQIQKQAAEESKERKERNWDRPGIPSWFGI